jgi:carboxylesterase
LEAFAASSADDWLEAARAELAILSASHSYVAVIGLSMGGALAAILASESPDVRTLVLLSPYLAMPLVPGLVARFHRQVTLVAPVIAGRGAKSIRDKSESARNLAYGMATPRLLAELRLTVRRANQALPRVTVPTLYIQSHHDNRISPATAKRAFARLGATVKRLEWIDDGAHIITVDFGRDKVIASVAQWTEYYYGSDHSPR